MSMLSRPGSKQIDILGYGEDPNQSPKVVARLPFDMEAIIRPERPLNLLASRQRQPIRKGSLTFC